MEEATHKQTQEIMQKASKEMKRNVIVLILWTAFLLVVLLAPLGGTAIPSPLRFEHFDKVAHFCLFAVTGFVGVYGANFRSQFKYRILFGVVFGLFLGVGTEFGQSLVSRDTSLYDLLADVIGLGAGLVLYAFLYSRYTVRSFLRL
jgi:VanZ family protein